MQLVRRPRILSTLVLAGLVAGAAAACGDDGGGGGNTDGGGAGGDGGGTPDASPISGDRYALTFGPYDVAPGQEDTRCVTLRLNNPTPIKVHTLHNNLGDASHHFIVYRDSATAESPTPTPCTPFAGTLGTEGAAPLMITQRSDETLTLPDRVAFSFAASQMIRLEMHYINTTDVMQTVLATAEFFAVPDSEIDHEADFLFIGSPDIDLAPGATSTLQAYFPVPASLDGSNYFAITGHTHQLGTDMQVGTRPSAGGARSSVYAPTPFLWDEPDTTRHTPPFTIPPGGGFDFQCAYNNTSGQQVGFGESANDEMCFFWAYYYPSRGAKVCAHSDQFGGVNICCPDAGAAICSRLLGAL
ncbi:MAG: hypothetical protein KBG28_25585 [Kofleriaceae bacterium]|nr:hypothetical protein [Kofleriaceae bacterium]